MANRLPCGHNELWTLRLTDRGQRYVYCIGCLVDAAGIKTVDGKEAVVIKAIKPKSKGEKNESNKKVVQKTKV